MKYKPKEFNMETKVEFSARDDSSLRATGTVVGYVDSYTCIILLDSVTGEGHRAEIIHQDALTIA